MLPAVTDLNAQAAMRSPRLASFIMSSMKRLWREPLTHFLLLGAVLLAASPSLPPPREVTPSSKTIQLSLDELSQLALLFQSQWRRPPTAQELGRLVENRMQEEILYREALALGLDKDDTIVKRRMVQK